MRLRLARFLGFGPNRPVLGTSRLFTLLLVSCLVAVELTGRLAATDMGDGITFLLVLMLAVMVAVRHRTMEMPWVTRGFGWLRRNGESILRWRPEFGIDHRNEPKWRSGVPIPWSRWIVPGLGLALVALGLTLTGASPDGLRNAARTVSTVVWSVGLGLVWSILAMAILAMALASVLYLIPGVATYLARGRSTANHTLRAGGILALVLFLPLGLASALIAPAWAALGVVLAAAVARPFLRFTPSPTLDILFRDRRGEVLAIEWRELAWRSSALFVVVVLVLGALTVGDSITKDLGHALTTTTPVTRGLGVLFLWVACGASCVSHGAMIHAVVIGRRHDPRRVLPQRVCVREAPSEAEFLRLRDGLQRAGFEVLAPTATHTPGEVVIDVVSLRSCTTLAIRGGRVEAPENIDVSTLAAAVHRRHERQCRRQALKRTRRLFREIRKTMGRSGEALVFAPHLWHMTAIQRDDSDVDGDETHYFFRPTPYHLAYSHQVRSYFSELFSDLEIDLMVIDDSLPWGRLEPAFRALFESRDLFGAQRGLDLRCFDGIRGLRAILHDQMPEADGPLARARILQLSAEDDGDELAVVPQHPAVALGVS